MPCYNIIQWEQRGWVMMDREEEDVGEKGGGWMCDGAEWRRTHATRNGEIRALLDVAWNRRQDTV